MLYREPWPERHPVLLGFGVLFAAFTIGVGILFGACAITAFWQLFLVLGISGGLGLGVRPVVMERRRREDLSYHADYEDWLLRQGHPAGMFGRYPPYRV